METEIETEGIRRLYELLVREFENLQNTSYPKHKLNGFEDALWDFKVIAKDDFAIDLPIAQNNIDKADNSICICGHLHKEHLAPQSINYTAGRCTKCTCKNFIIVSDSKKMAVDIFNIKQMGGGDD